MGHDPPRVLHPFRDVQCLAARRRAEVEDGFPGVRVEFVDRKESAGVLEVEPAFLETPKLGDPSDARQFLNGTLLDPVVKSFLVADPFRIPAVEDLRGGRSQPVDPGEDRWRGVHPTAESLELVGAVSGRPAGDEPGRERPSPSRVCALEVFEPLSCRFAVPDHVPQDRVHEPRLGGESETPRQLNGVVDHGVVRDPVEPKKLIDPETQECPGDGWGRA